jgi:hypothetical protein
MVGVVSCARGVVPSVESVTVPVRFLQFSLSKQIFPFKLILEVGLVGEAEQNLIHSWPSCFHAPTNNVGVDELSNTKNVAVPSL